MDLFSYKAQVNNDGFYIFEANYRLRWIQVHIDLLAELTVLIIWKCWLIMLLTGKMEGYDLSLDNPKFNKCCCSLDLVSKGGMVGKIIGLEEIRKKKNLIAVDKMYDVGDYIEKSGTLRQIASKVLPNRRYHSRTKKQH